MKNALRTYNRALNDLQFKPTVSEREETIKPLKNLNLKPIAIQCVCNVSM